MIGGRLLSREPTPRTRCISSNILLSRSANGLHRNRTRGTMLANLTSFERKGWQTPTVLDRHVAITL